jgi:hypothetical protein
MIISVFSSAAPGRKMFGDDGNITLAGGTFSYMLMITRIAKRKFLLFGNPLAKASRSLEDIGFQFLKRDIFKTPGSFGVSAQRSGANMAD